MIYSKRTHQVSVVILIQSVLGALTAMLNHVKRLGFSPVTSVDMAISWFWSIRSFDQCDRVVNVIGGGTISRGVINFRKIQLFI
jgi:hypothetical protein